MNGNETLSISSLLMASSLVLVALVFSWWQRLKLEKDIVISVIRAVIQLVAVGFVLEYIFGFESPVFTTLLLLFMISNAAYNAARRGRLIHRAFVISLLSICTGAVVTLSILVASGSLRYEPYQIIPVSGMIISNTMIALGLVYKQLSSEFKLRRLEVETKLALGADILPSSIEIIRSSIRTAMMPTIDSAKTLGIVSLPGMMTGLILAGTAPLEAIKYQLMVTFMLLSSTSIASFIACYFGYRSFFNARKQLVLPEAEEKQEDKR